MVVVCVQFDTSCVLSLVSCVLCLIACSFSLVSCLLYRPQPGAEGLANGVAPWEEWSTRLLVAVTDPCVHVDMFSLIVAV